MNRTSWSLVLRITSISVGIYEYILTLPAEWNFYFGYKRRNRNLRWDVGAILFGLIRYVTIMAITFNNVGFFVEGFSVKECERFHTVSPVLKVVQVMLSQTILGLRTYGISGRNKNIGIFLLIFGIICTAGEWFIDLYGRKFLQNQNMNCIATNDPDKLYTWGFYLIAMVYDLVTFSISTYHLLRGLTWDLYKLSNFVRRLTVDGMQYFVALTAVNILNLIVYRSKDPWFQSSAAPFGYLITWIMSQRILIHMRESARAEIPVLPIRSMDLAFSAESGNELDAFDRQGETRPGSRYEETDSENTLRNENAPDPGKGSLSLLDEYTPSKEPQSSRQLDHDDDDNDTR